MQFRIHRSVPESMIRAQLPPHLAQKLSMLNLPPGEHTFAIFEISDRPVRDTVVERALIDIGEAKGFIAIAGEFTVAAAGLLQARDVLFVTKDGASWSEERWDYIRQL
jgi:hypothetical protein